MQLIYPLRPTLSQDSLKKSWGKSSHNIVYWNVWKKLPYYPDQFMKGLVNIHWRILGTRLDVGDLVCK